MFINSRTSLKNHTRFQTTMGKVYTQPFELSAHTYKGVPAPPPLPPRVK